MRPLSLARSLALALLTTTALTPLLGVSKAVAQNLPTGTSVASGSVGVQRSQTTLTLNQSSQNAIVNYSAFSIGQGYTVTINQPTSTSVILNRVTGDTPSTIAGQLNANGQVYLINPNGIAITKTGVVKIGGGFVASTLAMTDDEFKHGRKHFIGNGSSAGVSNAGIVTIGRGGYAALIGGEVTNSGLIAVPMGKVGLGSGEAATLDVSGDGFLQVAVPTLSGGKSALIQQSGTISADGGMVVLTAATARAAARDAINIPGTIDARSIGGQSGAILIGGGEGGGVEISGDLDASSPKGGGGAVTVTGETIALKGASIDASGATGGGAVKIGGDFHGAGALQQADQVTIDANSKITADATEIGDGGAVAVWSTGATTVAGAISAMGGPQGGDGGMIETSGANLNVTGASITAAAPKGAAGAWLLDPTDLIIDQALATSVDNTLNGGTSVTLATSASGAPTGAALTAGETNASGNGDILVNAPLAWSSAAGLTLNAYNNIAVNAPITFGGAGSGLTLNAGAALNIAAPIKVNGAGTVSLAYNTAAPTNLSFGLTTAGAFAGGVTYNNANGSAATSAVAGQSLSVNGAPYTLVYNMTDVANINTALGGNYALATNIDASASIANPYTGAVVGGFSGTFEGLGDTISNLTIHASTPTSYIGLFSSNSGTLRDFALSGGSVTADSVNGVYNAGSYDFAIASGISTSGAAERTGSVVGQNGGLIFNVASSAAVTGDVAAGGLVGVNTGTILGSMASGAVAAGAIYPTEGYEIGGLVGLNYTGTVSGSWATGAVSGYTMVGGLIGEHDNATTTSSFATGSVTGNNTIGGLIGDLEGGTLQSSYATGAVTGVTYVHTYPTGYIDSNGVDHITGYFTDVFPANNIGGLVGEVYENNYYSSGNEQSTTIAASYATGNVTSPGNFVGGLIGFMNTDLPNSLQSSSATTLTGVYATGAVSGSQNVGGLVGQFAFATLNDATLNIASAAGAVSGNQAVGGLIGQQLSGTVNNASASGAVTGTGSGVEGVGGLIGVFNSVYPGHSEAANISASGAVTAPDGANYVGGLIGLIGTDDNYSYSAISISNASATGSVTVGANTANIGGLIGADGLSGLTIVGGSYVGNSLANGAGSADIDSSFASGAVTAGDYATAVGGLIGNANDNQSGLGIANSYATSSVTVGKNATNIGGLVGDDEIQGVAYNSQLAIRNDFATGSVTAGAAATNVGGLFGTMNSVEIDGVYATGAVTVGPYSSAIGGFAGAIGSPSIPSAVGAFGYIDLYGFSTGRVSAGPGSTFVDASIGANGQTVQPYDYIVYNSDTAGVGSTVGIAETTADFTQNGSVASALNSNLSWAGISYTGGTNGLYPYQAQIFPNGVQAITGYAYNANGTVAQSAGVALAGLGPLGQTTTGANGAYYIALPAGTLGTTTLTTAASLNAATLTTVAATGVQSGVNLYGNTLSTLTTATLLSAAPSQAQTRTQALTAAGTDAAALSALAGATGYGLVATGSSFTIDQGVSASGPFVAATATAGAPLTVAAPVSAAGSVLLQTSGALTIASGGSVSGASPVLATTGAFINQAGGAAVTATSGAWQIFSAAPTGDTFGGLNSGDMAIWNTPLGTAAAASGDRYVFAYAPVLTVATVNDAKTYGVDATSAVAGDYVITGLQAGVAGAYLGDTAATAYSGAASVTSPGAGAGAVVGGYVDQLGLGTLTPSAGYSFNLQNTAAFTVNPALLTITANNASKTYGQVATLGATAFTATGLVTANGDALTSVTLASGGVAATATVAGGPYAITGSNAVGAGLGNYMISYANGALTVNPAALTITANATSSTYGSTPSGLTGAVTGLVNGETLQSATTGALSFATTATATSNVGAYAITGSGLTAISGNYTLVQAPANTTALTINPATLTYTATAASSTYGSTPSGLTGAVTGLVNGQTLQAATTGALSFATTATAISNVGSYAINGAGLTANNGDYIFAQAAANSSALTVNPAALTITASNQSKTYGQTAGLGATAFTQTGLVNSDTVSAVTLASTGGAATANVAASPYAITASNAVGSGLGNYTISYGAGLLTVNPAALTYTATAASSTYGSTPSGLTGAVTGLVNGETLQAATTGTLSFATTTSATSNVGNYAITGSGLTATNANYTFVQATANNTALTVNPLAVTLTGAQVYNATTAVAGSALSVTNLVGADSVTVGGGGTIAGKDVGSQALTALNGLTLSNANYTLLGGSGAVTVTPASLAYAANAANRTYGAANPTLSGTVTGFVGGDTQATATSGTLGFATNATMTSNVGSYAIIGSGLTTNNGDYILVQAPANSGALSITPATLTYTANAASSTYGSTPSGLTGAVSGLVNGQTLQAATTGTVSFATTATTASPVGSYAITGTGLTANNGDYTFVQALGNSSALTVNPALLTITASNQSKSYGQVASLGATAFTETGLVTANGDTVGGVTLASTGAGATATVAGGPYAITASNAVGAGLGNYMISYANGALTVNPAALTITANATSSTYGSTPSGLTGAVTGLVNGETLQSATTGALSFATTATATSNVGAYAITGSGLTAISGNYTLVQAPANTTALTINPATLTYTATAASSTYGSTPSGLTGAVTGLVNGQTLQAATTGALSFATTATAISNVGSYAINGAGLTANNGDYIFAQAAANSSALTVNPAALTITASNQSKTYGQTAGLGATAFTQTGLVNSDTVSAVTLASTGSAATANVAASPYAITASNATGSGLGNYTISYGTGLLIVNPAALTYTANAASSTYGSTPSGLTGGVTGLVNGETLLSATTGTLSFATTATASSNVGSYAVTGSGLSATNANYTFVQAPGNNTALTVNPATLTYTASAASSIYGSAPAGLTGTVTGLVNGQSLQSATTGMLGFTTTATGASNVGSYAITGSGLTANNGDYTFAQAAGNGSALTVNPRAIILSGAQTYNGATTAAAANLTISNLVAGDTVGLSGAGALASKNTGAEALASANGALSGLSVSNANYTVVGGSGVVTVNPLAVTLAGTQVYNGTAAVAGSALSVTNLVGGDSVTVAGGGAMAGKDVGSQALASLTGLALSNANYTVLGGSGSVTVTPASLTYTANAASRTYGATNPMLSGTVTGFVGGDTQASATSGTLGFASTATSASNVGSYAVTGSGLTANNGDYTLAQAAANSSAFTVNPATLTITANNTSKTYGQMASLGAMAFTQTGLVTANGDAISGVTLGSAGAAAAATVAGGPYTIMVSNAQGAGLGNYAINYLNGVLTVNPAALTITANNTSKTYGQTVSLGATAFSETGLVNSDAISSVTLASGGATTGASVNGGTPYAITASNATGSGLSNYTISYGNGALTVNPATLAITASNQSKTYGQTASLGATAFNEAGLVNGDTIAGVVLASPGAAATATVAGPYAITASNATGSGLGNYTISYGTGALTVNPATLTITADNASKIYGQTASLGATAFVETGLVNSDTVSGVSLTSTGAAPTATVSGGPYVITASNAIGTGLGNYAISYANGALAVSPATLTITANNTSKTYGQTASLGATAFAETGLVTANGDTISGVALASTGAAAGASVNSGTPYAISASNATGSGLSNYTIGYVAGGLTVTPLAVTLAGAQVYNGTTAVAGSALSVTNLVGGDNVIVAGGGALAGKDVGAQALASLTGLTLNNANYTLLGGSGSVTVTPADLTYTANAATRTYGASDPTLSGTVTGFVGGDTQASATSGTLNFASSATTASNVGSYAITGSGLTANNGDYVLGQAPANSSALAITPATLTYAANAASSTYGSTPSGLTGAVTGLVNGQTLQAATTGTLSFTAAATAISNVGSYAITGSGLTANNGDYTFAQAAGNASALSVNPAALAITADNASKTYGQTASLGTTAFTEAGLVNGDTVSAVTLASTGAAATATVAGGPYAITASNATGSGLSNYTISYGNGALTVNPATLASRTAPAFGLAAIGLGSTIESAALGAFGNPGGSPPLITSTLWSLPSSENDLLAAQIVGDLSNPLFDKIVVCFKGVCTLAPAPAPPRNPQTTSQIPGWDHAFSLDAKSPFERLSTRFGPGT